MSNSELFLNIMTSRKMVKNGDERVKHKIDQLILGNRLLLKRNPGKIDHEQEGKGH
jgi:hypothetical protein